MCLSDDDDENEEEEYDADDDIDVTATCLAAVYILCGRTFFPFFITTKAKESKTEESSKKREKREKSLLHSYSSMYIIDNT